MDFDKLNRWVTLVANIGVVAGIFFLAIDDEAQHPSNTNCGP